MSFTSSPCKQRLMSLMGSDEVRVNDKRYMQKLKKRLDEDYQVKLRKRQEALALNEVKREKRLILAGVISQPIDELEKERARQRAPRRRKKKRKHSKGSQHDGTNSDEIGEESYMGSISGPSVRSQSCCHGDSSEKTSSSEDDTLLSQQNGDKDGGDADEENINETSRNGHCHGDKRDPVLCNLMGEESVAGLYSLAEKLVTK